MPLFTTLIPIGFIGFIVISLFKGNWMLAIGGGVAYYLYFKLVVQGLLGMWSNPEKSSEKIAEPSEIPQEEKMRIEQGDAEAAENEDAEAQYNLGVAYVYGDGVPQDYKEGVKWYRKAADQGHVEAKCGLGYAYYSGEGVIEDKVQAYTWYNIAAANGNETGKEYKAGIAEQMTEEQIAEAEKLSTEMIKANPKLMGN